MNTDIKDFEEKTHCFKKIIESLNLPKAKETVVFDASLKGLSIPYYLQDRMGYKKIYSINDSPKIQNRHIVLLSTDQKLETIISNHKSDLFIALSPPFLFEHTFESVYAISKNLNVGGKLIISTYPDLYDEKGQDILGIFSNLIDIPIKEKLHRQHLTLQNALSNIFKNISSEEVLVKASKEDIIELFNLDLFYKNLFYNDIKNLLDNDIIFEQVIFEASDLTLLWHIIYGHKF
ncbi:MAG: hypothetical protein N3C60_06495 [Calditerrivibrio sp.]|nr:hypothetical protein [Calditerrivibrio sp.]